MDKVPQDIGILVSINRKFETSFRHWQDTIGRQMEIYFEDVWTEEQIKEAIGSFNFWIDHRHTAEDLMLIAGDNYFEFKLSKFIASYNGTNTILAVYDIGDKSKASRFGVVRLDVRKIVELEEKPAKTKSSLITTACYIFPPWIFPSFPDTALKAKATIWATLLLTL